MDTLWQIAVYGGIGVVAYLVFWLLINQFLKMPIFSKLTRDQTHHTLNRVLLFIFIVAVLGIVTYAVITLVRGNQSNPSQSHTSKSELRVVSASFDSGESEVNHVTHYPTLDIKLRNPSQEVSFIKKAIIQIKKKWELEPYMTVTTFVEPSKNYMIKIPKKEAPFTVPSPLSQAVKPGETERITFTFWNGKPTKENVRLPCVLQMEMQLVYDEDDKTVNVGPFLFLLAERGQRIIPNEKDKQEKKEMVHHNTQLLHAVSENAASKSSRLTELIASYLKKE